MVIAKGLIFKSLLGIATSGVVIVPIVLTKLSNKKTEEDTADDTNSESNRGVNVKSSPQTTINTGSQQTTNPGNGSNAGGGSSISTNAPVKPEEVDTLGIPKSCTTSTPCQLTKNQLEKIKFEPKNAGSTISINGLGTNDKVTLTITSVSKNSNYPKNKKYNFKTSAQKTATITGTKENISITSAGIDFREKSTGGQLEKAPVVQKTQAPITNSLGLPESCKVNQVKSSGTTKQECQLTVDDLKKVKFKVFDGKTGDTSVSGLESAPNNKIKLTISWDSDKSDYPDNKKYSFTNTTDKDIEVSKGDQKVKIAKTTESWFKNDGNKLSLFKTKLGEEKEKKMKEVNEELTKLGLSALIKLEIGDFKNDNKADFEGKTVELNKAEMKSIQFGEFNAAPTSISGWDDESKKIKLKLDYATSASEYPKNMKFSFQNNTGSDITISHGQKSLKFQNSDKWETFKVNNSSELERTQGK